MKTFVQAFGAVFGVSTGALLAIALFVIVMCGACLMCTVVTNIVIPVTPTPFP